MDGVKVSGGDGKIDNDVNSVQEAIELVKKKTGSN